jgi:nitrate/nitrite transport system ATP-binding protein
MDKYLSVEAVDMSFGASEILTGIDLTIRKGEFVTLIGHSGCGKSTLLNLVAGLIKPTRGAILLAGKHVDGPGPDRGVVFQNHSLLPWLTCYENVHLAVERVFKADLRKKAQAALELVGLSHAEQK